MGGALIKSAGIVGEAIIGPEASQEIKAAFEAPAPEPPKPRKKQSSFWS